MKTLTGADMKMTRAEHRKLQRDLALKELHNKIEVLLNENKNLRNHISLLAQEKIDMQNTTDILHHNVRQLQDSLTLAQQMLSISLKPRLIAPFGNAARDGEPNAD